MWEIYKYLNLASINNGICNCVTFFTLCWNIFLQIHNMVINVNWAEDFNEI